MQVHLANQSLDELRNHSRNWVGVIFLRPQCSASFAISIGSRKRGISLLSGRTQQLMALLRVAGFSRELSAGLLASLGDLLDIDDPGAAIGVFDAMSADEVRAAASWISAPPRYRAALAALGNGNG